MKDDDEDAFDEVGEEDEDASIDIDAINLKRRAGRTRRGWREVERMREQKEIERLLRSDDWFDELERY